jgi:hypothetical protein
MLARCSGIKHVLISVSTPTYAMKVKRILRNIGINGEIIKMNSDMGRGCTHAVKIHRDYFYKAAEALRQNNIPYSVFEE